MFIGDVKTIKIGCHAGKTSSQSILQKRKYNVTQIGVSMEKDAQKKYLYQTDENYILDFWF